MRWRTLRCMRQPAQSLASPASANFAGLLAALASPQSEEFSPANTSNESDLGDDVVTLSYESALRSHARYKTPDRGNREPVPATRVDVSLTAQAGRVPQDVLDHELRTTSVTVRLSKAECASLHQRAAEAGLSVSAYLRSCTMEAEALRAQVKAALAELRSAASKTNQAVPGKERRSFRGWVIFGWLARLLPRTHSASQAG